MEAFSLLKYWRGGGGVFARDSTASIRTVDSSSSATTTTIVTAVSPSSSSDSDDDNDDDGPFFDLEFAIPDDSDNEDQMKEQENVGVAASVENFANGNKFEDPPKGHSQREPVGDVLSDNEFIEGEEIKFTLSSSPSDDSADPNITLSPSHDLFFKGRLVPIESSSLALNPSEAIPKFPVSSILKSATKFRVLMLKLNKSKSNVREKSAKSEATVSAPKAVEKNQNEKEGEERRQQNKFFTVKLKVEEVPIVSLFTRENSSNGNVSKINKRNSNETENSDTSSSSNGAPDDKKFSKDVMQKYLKKVKPLYIRVSKRYGEKLKFSGQLSLSKPGAGPSSAQPPTTEVKSPPAQPTAVKAGGEAAEVAALDNVKSQKQGNLQAGLRVVCKHLAKSRSASSAAVAAAPSAQSSSRRRDDSLLEQQDGIQGAILHCKRSFKASRELPTSILLRSVSDSSHEQCVNSSTEDSSSSEEAKAKGTC